MPISADKKKLAMRMYCYDQRPRVQIAQELDVDPFELNAIARDEEWEKLRQMAQFIRNDIDSMDPLKEHDKIVNDMLRLITIYKDKLMSEELEAEESKRLRSKIESLKSLSEAASLMIKSHRDVHGLRAGTPSATNVTEEQGVQYVVAKPPAAKEKTG